jgi:hypothetical protein
MALVSAEVTEEGVRGKDFVAAAQSLKDRGVRADALTSLRISGLSLGDAGLAALATTCARTLVTLDVSRNAITEIPREVFTAMQRLRTLDASENRIAKLSKRVGAAAELETLRLDGNRLRSLPLDAILAMKKIKLVGVHRNYISTDALSRERVLYAQWVCAGLGQQRVPNRVASIPQRVYIGSVEATEDPDELRRLGITHVLSVGASPVAALDTGDPGFATLRLSIIDWPMEDLRPHIEKACAFIDAGTASDSKGVLVHCLAGQSRSVAFVLAWLISRRRMGFDEAFALVRRSRFVSCPNMGF